MRLVYLDGCFLCPTIDQEDGDYVFDVRGDPIFRSGLNVGKGTVVQVVDTEISRRKVYEYDDKGEVCDTHVSYH